MPASEVLLSVSRGNSENLPAVSDGQIIFTKDTEKLMVDYSDSNTVERSVVNPNPDWNASSGNAQILNKPTTLSGYGITDAGISSGTIRLGNVSLKPVPTDGTDTLTSQEKSNVKQTLGISATVTGHKLSLSL